MASKSLLAIFEAEPLLNLYLGNLLVINETPD